MATSPKQVLSQLSQLWRQAGPKARASVTAGTLAAMLAFAWMSLGPGAAQHVLFSGLDAKDAAAMVAVLDTAKIDYQLDAGGSVIRVPAKDVDRARLLLAEQDLPGGGNVGFEIFEEQALGLTDFAQKVNYRRALQGELERTITALDPVASARVHLTLPERAVFEDERVAPSASVTLDMRSGRNLGRRQVGAIRHLVAAAVEGLDPGAVTVVDTKGTLLSRGDVDAASAASLDFKRDMERDMERRITRLLERTVGVGGAHVTVSADVDFSRTDTTEEIYDPEQLALRSESISKVEAGARAGRPGGLAGAPANQPGANTAGQAGAGASGTSQLVSDKKYELNRTVIHTEGPSAAVKRVTVAVMVDGTYTEPEGGGEPVFTPLGEEQIASLQGVVESAIGFNAARGDRIKVVSVPFRDRPSGDTDGGTFADRLPSWVPYAAGGGALALIGIVWLVMSRGKKGRPVTPEILPVPATVSQLQRVVAQGEATAPSGPPALAGDDARPGALPEAPGELKSRVLEHATSDPERTAEIVRGWMKEAA